VTKYLTTQLRRLGPGKIIYRNANTQEVWDEIVAVAKTMPHLSVHSDFIERNQKLPEVKLVVSNRVRDIVVPAPGRYTLHDIWQMQTEPRPTFASFASSFGMYARFNPHLVYKAKSNGYTKWIITPPPSFPR
jgi:hypothetical protein